MPIYHIHIPVIRKCIQLERWPQDAGWSIERDDGGLSVWLGWWQLRIDAGDYQVPPSKVPAT